MRFLKTALCSLLFLTVYETYNPNQVTALETAETANKSKAKAVPTAAPLIPIEKYAALPKAMQLELSPNGNYAAYLTPNKGRISLIFKDLTGELKPFLIPALKNAELSWFRFASNDYLLVSYQFTSNEYGHKYTSTRLVTYHVRTKKFRLMMKPKRGSNEAAGFVGNIQDNVLDLWPEKPDYFLLALDTNGDGNAAIRKVHLKTGHDSAYYGSKDNIQDWTLDAQKQARMAYGYSRTKRVIKYRNPETNKWQDATKMAWYQKSYGFVDFTEDPRIAYMLVPNENGVNGMVKYNMLEDKILEPLFQHERYDATGLAYDSSTGKVIGVRYTHAYDDVFYINAFYAKLKKTLMKAFGKGHVEILAYNRKKKIITLRYTSDEVAGGYYALYVEKANVKPIFFDRDVAIDQTLSPTQKVTFKARDGLPIEGYLTLPRGIKAEKLPTIIMPHGGPQARDDAYYHFEAQMLANRGYAILRPNFRGSTGYGDYFQAAGRKQWGGTMQDDLTDATHWMIEEGITDPKRICIMGGSYGGYASLMALVKEQDLYQCAISINGVTDIAAMRRNDKNFIGGRVWGNSWGLDGSKDKEISPYHQWKKIKKPALLIHSVDDARVPYKQSKKLYSKLKRADLANYVEIKKGGHSLDTEAARLKSLKAVEAFLKKHLPTSRNN